jgi:hypothetical protein
MFVAASFGRGLFGLVGVFGRGDFALSEEALDEVVVFAVDIGLGLAAVFVAEGLSTVFAVVGFIAPFDFCPLFAAFFPSAWAGLTVSLFSSFPVGMRSCLFSSNVGVVAGVKIAFSGMISSMTALCFRASISVAIDCFLSAVACGSASSLMLKLGLLFVMLGSPLSSLFRPTPGCPLLSTATKLVRTRDSLSVQVSCLFWRYTEVISGDASSA